MRAIEKKETYVYTVWQATDGNEFATIEECRKYEQSALGVMIGRVSSLIVGKHEDARSLMGGCDDYEIVTFKLTSTEEVNMFLQFLFLVHPWYLDKCHTDRKKEVENIVTNACKKSDVILMGKNCDDEYYFINSRQNIIDNLMKLDKEETDNAK